MKVNNWHFAIAFLLSVFYGVRANFVEKHTSVYGGIYKKTAMFLNAIYLFIFHFLGSLVGWYLIYYLNARMCLYPDVKQLGFIDVLLLLFGFLGVTGHLPQTLYGFVLSFGKIAESVSKKIAE